ncbi:MAG: translesion error-prone DNA polymerase V autoproteolytic subunit [Planctomycetota bacterium]|jgi:DNA polymerase V|nr:translesion error-prone DNA polymerase V autoproteolytic subunit [Planctomycetota bacterium]
MPPAPETRVLPVGPAKVDPPAQAQPVGLARAALGFPSPADDYEDDGIDLNAYLVRNPAATYYYRAEGLSMTGAGIFPGDLLAVDRSVTPLDGNIVIASWDGNAPSCKVLRLFDDHVELECRNPECQNIVLKPGTEVEIFVVTGVVRLIRREHGRNGR